MKHFIDKTAIANSFSKAAAHYDQFAQLQRDIGEKLLSYIMINKSDVVMDLGCGTGYFSEKLTQQFPNSRLTCFDISNAMLTQTKKRGLSNVQYQLGDIDNLPFTEACFDLIFSNLVVQWSDDFSYCVEQIKNSLKKGGSCYISTLLDGTLTELSQAWKTVDDAPHTNNFLTLAIVQSILNNAGFSSVKLTTETKTLAYKNVVEVMRALKGIGANHVHGHKAPSVSGRQLIKQLEEGYLPFTNNSGQLNLTYQVCYIEVIK